MPRKTMKLSAVALLFAALAGAVFLSVQQRSRHPVAPPATAHEPALVEEAALPIAEPARPTLPLIPPDPKLPDSGSVAVTGRMVDHLTGSPIAGASIETLPFQGSATTPSGTTTRTDEQGSFEFEAALRAMATLRVSAAGYATVESSLSDFVHPHENMSAGEVFRIEDVHLRRGVRPIVRVLDAGSKPVAGAPVVLCEASSFAPSTHARRLGTTDDNGEWAASEPIAGRSNGTWLLAASGTMCGSTPLALQRDGSGDERLDIVLQPAVEIELQAQANGPVSRPLAGVEVGVDVYPMAVAGFWRAVAQTNELGASWLHAKTDEHGVAHLRLPRIDGFHDALSLYARREGFDTLQVTVREDALREPVKLLLQPSPSPKLAHAADGTVLDAAGHPVPGAVVRCRELTSVPDPTTGAFHLDLGNMPFDRARALTAEAPGHAVRRVRVFDAQDPIAAAFVLDPLTCLRGTVVDEHGIGIAGIPVALDHVGIDATTRTRADGTYCLVFPWKSDISLDEVRVQVGALRDADAPYEHTVLSIDDPQHVDVALKPRSIPIGSVAARVVDDETSQPAPVVNVLLMTHAGFWDLPFVQQDRIVTDVGSFRATHMVPGTWTFSVESSDGRVGSGSFEVRPDHPAASIEVRVGPLRSVVVRIVPADAPTSSAVSDSFVVQAEPLAAWPRVNLLLAGSGSVDRTRRARVGFDGTYTFDQLVPGSWKITAEGATSRSERTVVVTTRGDVHLTMQARPRSEAASLQLTNLDGRFDGPLYVRLEREHEDPVEFVADPLNGRAQTFPVWAGESHLTVFPMHDDVPDVDAPPITRLKLDIAAGATEVVALYPR